MSRRPKSPYQSNVFRPFIPKLVENGEGDGEGEGDGSDASHVANEDEERWDVIDRQLKSSSTLSNPSCEILSSACVKLLRALPAIRTYLHQSP